MIDLILFCFTFGAAYVGFLLGAKYGTMEKLVKETKQKIASWFAKNTQDP